MTLKTAASFLLVLFLVTIEVFPFELQLAQSFKASIPFGDASVVGLSRIPSFSQNISVKMWGNIGTLFYVNGEIDNTALDNFTLTYLPWNAQFGSVSCQIPNGNSVSLVGVTFPSFSIGQMRGAVKSESFLAKKNSVILTIGPIIPGSLDVYVNGTEIPDYDYNVNCESGVLKINDINPGDVVSLTYQNVQGSQGYLAGFQRKIKFGNAYLSAGMFDTISKDNDFYLFSGLSNGNFGISTWLDFEKVFSFEAKLTDQMDFGYFKSSFELNVNTPGFHKPFGTPKAGNFSFSLKGTALGSDITLNGNLNALNALIDVNNTSLFMGVGKDENLDVDFSNDFLSAGFTLSNTFKGIYMGVSNDTDSISLSYQSSKGPELEVDLSSTPLSLSLDLDGEDNFLSLQYRNVELDFEQEPDDTSVEVSGKLFSFLKYDAGFELKYATPCFFLSSELQTAIGDFSISMSASQTFSLKGSFSQKSASIGLSYAEGVLKSKFEFSTKLFYGWKGDFSVEAGFSKDGWGGSVTFETWRKEF